MNTKQHIVKSHINLLTKLSHFIIPTIEPHGLGTKLIIRSDRFCRILPKIVLDTKETQYWRQKITVISRCGPPHTRKLNQDEGSYISVSDTTYYSVWTQIIQSVKIKDTLFTWQPSWFGLSAKIWQLYFVICVNHIELWFASMVVLKKSICESVYSRACRMQESRAWRARGRD